MVFSINKIPFFSSMGEHPGFDVIWGESIPHESYDLNGPLQGRNVNEGSEIMSIQESK